IYEGSICARVINEIYRALPKQAFHEECGCMRFNPATAIFFYAKPYRGKMRRKELDRAEVTFYNEREWRYVPFADHTIKGMDEIPAGIRPMLAEREYANADILGSATTALHTHYKLGFEAEDVRYLIVKEEDEIPDIFDFINLELKKYCENSELRNC